ncbi:PHP domain-containing protein [Paenibacillus sp. FSL H7-0716]|nr:PHP domain-containing protein [Paenibacillus odorifer]
MKKVDLHIHTTKSDGVYSVGQVMEGVKRNKIGIVSFTDHDFLHSVDDIQPYLPEETIYINGVEFSSRFNGKEVHILCYGYKEDGEEIHTLVKQVHIRKMTNAIKFCRYLDKHDVSIKLTEINQKYGNSRIGSICKEMISVGYISNENDFLSKYYEEFKHYHFQQDVTVEEIIHVIKKSGGIAVLAHPIRYSNDIKEVTSILQYLKNLGLGGIEAYHPLHTPDHQKEYNKLALRYELFVTGGSDFHYGAIDERLGTSWNSGMIPYQVIIPLITHIKSYHSK